MGDVRVRESKLIGTSGIACFERKVGLLAAILKCGLS